MTGEGVRGSKQNDELLSLIINPCSHPDVCSVELDFKRDYAFDFYPLSCSFYFDCQSNEILSSGGHSVDMAGILVKRDTKLYPVAIPDRHVYNLYERI